jgi:predicted RNA-binding Zn-ribbon protein involved in translation (DUF1610 family)
MENIYNCDNCNSIIKKYDEEVTTDIKNYTICDSCEATICIDCIGEQNECPICGKELTLKENF